MHKKSKLNAYAIVFSGITLLAGLFIGPIIDKSLNGILAGQDLFTVLFPFVGLIIIILCSALVLSNAKELSSSIQDFEKIAGRSVDMLSYENSSKTRESFQKIIGLINNAEDQIIALDYFPWSGDYDPDPEFKNYYTALNKYIEKNKPYVRIIQHDVEDLSMIKVDDIQNPVALKHLELVSKKSKVFNSRVSLMGSKVFMPHVSFLIIDKKYLVMEMPFIDTENIYHFSQDLYIADLTGKVVPEFVHIFEKIQKKSVTLGIFEPSANAVGDEVHS